MTQPTLQPTSFRTGVMNFVMALVSAFVMAGLLDGGPGAGILAQEIAPEMALEIVGAPALDTAADTESGGVACRGSCTGSCTDSDVLATGAACSDAVAAACRDPRFYAVFDALFLQRNNAAINRPLVVDSGTPSVPLLAAGDPVSTIGTGARVTIGDYGADGLGWEVGWVGLYGMQAARDVTSAGGSLQAGGDLGLDPLSPLRSASLASFTGKTALNTGEINLVFHEFDGGFDRGSRRPAQRCDGYTGGHVDWLAGFRWASLDDAATLAFTSSAPQPSTYAATTNSNLFAGQVGTRGRLAFDRWAVEGWMKIGIAGTALSQSQTTFDAITGLPFRAATSADHAGMGMIADMNLSAVWRIDDVWGVRCGYNLMWLTGVALAPDQWNFSSVDTPGAGTGLAGTGSICLAGANLGLEARW